MLGKEFPPVVIGIISGASNRISISTSIEMNGIRYFIGKYIWKGFVFQDYFTFILSWKVNTW